MVQGAALLYAACCAGVVVFQICLIAGAPWGPLTQGGGHPGALPVSNRVLAAASAVLLVLMAVSLLSAAGMGPVWPRWTGWAALAVQAASMLMNWITPSSAERRLWGPVTTLMLVLALVVMLG